MFRLTIALLLSLTLALTSYSMAVARGQSRDVGTDMVICTGIGMTTVSIDLDGKPVKTTYICPDAISIFAVMLDVPALPIRVPTMGWRVTTLNAATAHPQETLSPLARGPPLAV